MKWNLRNKFLVPTLTTIVLGMVIATYLSFRSSSQAIEGAVDAQLNQITAGLGAQLEEWVQDLKADVTRAGKNAVLVQGLSGQAQDATAASRDLAEMVKEYDRFELVAIADTRGKCVAASDAKLVGTLDVSDRSYFPKAMSGETVVSNVIKSRASGNPIFVVAAPVRRDGQIAGIILGAVDLAGFSDSFVLPIKVGQRGYAYVFNPEGKVIAYPDKSRLLELDLSQYEFGREMISKKSGFETYEWKGTTKLVSYASVPSTGWIVAAGAELQDILAPVYATRNQTVAIAVAMVLAVGTVLFLVVRSVANPVKQAVDGMSRGAEQVLSASTQLSGASQEMAEGASQQAASLEEISSSLEEMSSMTKQNAANAREADSMVTEASDAAEKGTQAMARMSDAIGRIKDSSDQTAKIIKTIDEIAFQTNLLALNAAVEAARAGEAGKGFAVVAEEVRNLAQRSAESAKSTASLIEASRGNSEDGVKAAADVNELLVQIVDRVNSVAKLVGQVNAASGEQAKGIEQVNEAVIQLDQVTQSNAANAEESASASEQLNAQADELQGIVSTLVTVVEGSSHAGHVSVAHVHGHSQSRSIRHVTEADYHQVHRKSVSHRVHALSGEQKALVVTPEKVIPLNDDDFADF